MLLKSRSKDNEIKDSILFLFRTTAHIEDICQTSRNISHKDSGITIVRWMDSHAILGQK